MTRVKAEKYYENKRQEVLKEIEPLLNGFMGIKKENYDYVIEFSNDESTYPSEYLQINNVKIGCNSNSVGAVVDEAFGYCIVKYYARNRHMGAFQKQTLNVIKQYWIDGKWYGNNYLLLHKR